MSEDLLYEKIFLLIFVGENVNFLLKVKYDLKFLVFFLGRFYWFSSFFLLYEYVFFVGINNMNVKSCLKEVVDELIYKVGLFF